MAPVEDPEKRDALDRSLVDALNARRTSGIEMTLPDDIPLQSVESLSYEGTDDRVAMLSTPDWIESIKDKLPNLSAEILKAFRITLWGEGDNATGTTIRAYDCLNFEALDGTTRFVLSGGEWFEVSASFNQDIDNYIRSITRSLPELLPAVANEDEPTYIKRISGLKKLHNLHTQRFTHDGDMIELCDLLSSAGDLIHLKRWTASATFSHLLAQGVICAETIQRSDEYRRQVATALTSIDAGLGSLFATPPFSTAKFCVVFGLIRPTKRDLPFFSRLNLVRVGEQIEQRGYRVGFQVITHA